MEVINKQQKMTENRTVNDKWNFIKINKFINSDNYNIMTTNSQCFSQSFFAINSSSKQNKFSFCILYKEHLTQVFSSSHNQFLERRCYDEKVII